METQTLKIPNTTGQKTPEGKDFDYLEIEWVDNFYDSGRTAYKFWYKDNKIVECE